MEHSPLAGQPAPESGLLDIARLAAAYYEETPDASVPSERVAFGTSGHRGTAFKRSFNEAHILAITQAIVDFRKRERTDGPLFLGFDTHALSFPAFVTALEVLAGNDVEVMISAGDEYTPTPVISHAILAHNADRTSGFADGIVVTPSHNPPQDGGFKYNPSSGGPAGTAATQWIEERANELLSVRLAGVRRLSYAASRTAGSTHRHDYISAYVGDLADVVDMDAIASSKLRLGVDPLGGAGVHYWGRIAERYGLDLTVVNTAVDATFRFMTLDWDGQIRMDPSSPDAMRRLIGLKDRFDLAFACDTDHDRHGIVTAGEGLLPPNHALCAEIHHLFSRRPQWAGALGIGKTVVSTQIIDRIAARLGRTLVEVPVGFKWFVGGLCKGDLGFAGEESAGATFVRRTGDLWTTDKDGIIPCLLAAEMTATSGMDPGATYQEISREFGPSFYGRTEAPANRIERAALAALSPAQVRTEDLAGDPITGILTEAPGNNAPIEGLKVTTKMGWFVARPSGTEDIYRIYAESFQDDAHLKRILDEAQALVSKTISTSHRPDSRAQTTGTF